MPTAADSWLTSPIVARLGHVPDRQIAREVGVSHEAVRQARVARKIPRVLSAGLSPTRATVLAAIVETSTIPQIALRAYGSEDDHARDQARQALYWLVKSGHVEHVRRGEYRATGLAASQRSR